MTTFRPAIRSKFHKAALGAAVLGAIGVGTGTVSVTTASLSPAQAQTAVTPVLAPAGAPLKKLSDEQCKFMVDRALEMLDSFKAGHFSDKFRFSVGGFATRNYDCSGKPVLEIGKPEDDRGVLMLWKTMGDNKKGDLMDSIVVYDPKGIAPLSKVLNPKRVVRTLPPEFASNGAAAPGPRG